MEAPDKKSTLENAGGEKIMADLGGARAGLPFYAFLDSAGKKIADSNSLPGGKNIGYPATPQEIAAFDDLLKKTAPRMSMDERMALVEHLKKVAPKQ